MKIILTAVNAKYIHSNLAVYTLQASAEKAGVFPEIREFTINQSKDSMLRSLFLAHADVVCVSCYIWNISIVEDLITEYHKISPETKIWLGGPEVSYHAEEMLEQYPFLDGIMKGEGEITFRELAVYYQNQENGTEGKTLEEIHGITYRDAEGAIKSNPWRPVMDLSEVDFPYANLKKFENRIIYYESSRGCPFSCSYCLSSISGFGSEIWIWSKRNSPFSWNRKYRRSNLWTVRSTAGKTMQWRSGNSLRSMTTA